MSKLRAARFDLIASVALAMAVFFAGFARMPVGHLDGPHRASMARNIVESGISFPPYYQGQPLPDHPPLYIWSIATTFKLFGYSDAAANFPGRLGAVLTALLIALLALKLGCGARTALAAVFILCTTRDFILGSTRGYIEPMLDVFFYGGFWFALDFRQSKRVGAAAAAGVCVFSAAFTKGPVALWPLVFYPLVLGWRMQALQTRRALVAYVLAIAACVALWALWVESRGDWIYWKQYWQVQVLGSAVGGRTYAQNYEPFFFLNIFAHYYWPWLPVLLWAIGKSVKSLGRGFEEKDFLFIFGLGFVAGFSLMRFKFWYYVSPAYPAFSLFMAASFSELIEKRLKSPLVPQAIAAASAAWFLVASVFPIPLWRERVPEVKAFKDTIRNSPLTGPVYCIAPSHDYNFIEKGGNWYFDRIIKEVTDELGWQEKLKGPTWVITSTEHWNACRLEWCRNATLIQTVGPTALVYATAATRTPR